MKIIAYSRAYIYHIAYLLSVTKYKVRRLSGKFTQNQTVRGTLIGHTLDIDCHTLLPSLAPVFMNPIVNPFF
jgi:hypothetical protein